VEGQLERLEQLLNEITTLHTIKKRIDIDPAAGTVPLSADSESDSNGFSDAAIAYSGSGLATVASRGCWEVKLSDIWDGCSKYGLDAWELRDAIIDPDDEDCTWIAAAVSVVKDVAVLALSTAHGIAILLERERNKECPVPLPCRPLPLASMTSADFQSRMIKLKRRLKRHRSSDLARNACDEQRELQLALTRSPRLKTELEVAAAKPTASFQSCWLPVMPGYPNLREVAAGLATVFPGSSSVESDFSILKQNKSPQRSRLADLSVEGQFHAQQWSELERLETLCVSEQADANE
jgi:hypothetical protein